MRRLDPFVDPLIAVVAVAFALTSLLTTDVDAIDPRLHDANLVAALATISGSSSTTRILAARSLLMRSRYAA